MMRSLLVSCLVFVALGCQQPVQSQENFQEKAPQSAVLDDPSNVSDSILRSRQNALTRAVEAASPAIVSVNVISVRQVRTRSPFSNDPFYDWFFGRQRSRVYQQQVQNVGSGFVISADGYVVTNDHVAGNATKITVSFPDGRTLDADLVGSDPATDLALLKVNPDEPLDYLAFSQTGTPIVGEWAIALGNPFGLFEAAEPSVTVGVVSAVDRDFEPQEGRIYRDMIQTDAAINRGNSGGPLINAIGEIIGVNTFIYTSGQGGSIGLGFAVPSDKVMRIIDELRETGRVDRSYYTGLAVTDVNARIARALDLTDERGVIVRDIDFDSPAEAAGFELYDVILSAEGETIDTRSDLVGLLYDFRPGDKVTFGILRDGREQTITMELGSTS